MGRYRRLQRAGRASARARRARGARPRVGAQRAVGEVVAERDHAAQRRDEALAHPQVGKHRPERLVVSELLDLLRRGEEDVQPSESVRWAAASVIRLV